MIVTILSIFLFLTFLILGGFHFYWLFGGRWGTESVFPTKPGKKMTKPIPPFATLVVALGLVSMGLLYLHKAELIHLPLPNWISTYAYWFIPGIFILRAIGEFNYVGMFKKITTTDFAKADTKIFVPLCFCIGLFGLLIQLLK